MKRYFLGNFNIDKFNLSIIAKSDLYGDILYLDALGDGFQLHDFYFVSKRSVVNIGINLPSNLLQTLNIRLRQSMGIDGATMTWHSAIDWLVANNIIN